MMGEHIYRVFVQDITRVRIKCQSCKGVAEVDAHDIVRSVSHGQCPFCREPYPAGAMEGFSDLQSGLQALAKLAKVLEVEFPIRLKEERDG